MASIDTAERTAQESTARDAAPAMRPLQSQLLIARWATITLTADSDAADDDIVLGKVGSGGTVFPEHCRLVGLSGSVQGTFKLQKVAADGTVTDLTGLATLATDDTSVAFLRKTGAISGAAFAETDYLQLTIGTATALAAGDTIELAMAYTSENVK